MSYAEGCACVCALCKAVCVCLHVLCREVCVCMCKAVRVCLQVGVCEPARGCMGVCSN